MHMDVFDYDADYALRIAHAAAARKKLYIEDVTKWLCNAARKSGVVQVMWVWGIALCAHPSTRSTELDRHFIEACARASTATSC